jgi:hypothetical protein
MACEEVHWKGEILRNTMGKRRPLCTGWRQPWLSLAAPRHHQPPTREDIRHFGRAHHLLERPSRVAVRAYVLQPSALDIRIDE